MHVLGMELRGAVNAGRCTRAIPASSAGAWARELLGLGLELRLGLRLGLWLRLALGLSLAPAVRHEAEASLRRGAITPMACTAVNTSH